MQFPALLERKTGVLGGPFSGGSKRTLFSLRTPTLYTKLLNKCTQLGKLREGRIVHAHFLRSHLSHYLVVQNAVLNMYAKCGCLDEARKVFDEMPYRDMVTWTALITGYSQNDRPQDALLLFPQMLCFGLEPNQFTFSSLLKAAGVMPGEKDGTQVHGGPFSLSRATVVAAMTVPSFV